MSASKSSLSSAFSPYTYVRTAVMRSLLFERLDYQKMMKMSSAELAKFLQDGQYKKEISALALQYRDEELLEKAVILNLGNTFRKLVIISREPLASFVKQYAMRKDVDDIKTILRGKFTGSDAKDIIKALSFAGFLEPEQLLALAKKQAISEVIKENGLFSSERLNKALAEATEKKNLDNLEWQLDAEYYKNLFAFASSLEDRHTPLVAFLYSEVDVANIMRLFRMKQAKLSSSQIKERVLMTNYPAIDRRLARLMQQNSVEGLVAELQKTEYKNAVTRGSAKLKETSSLVHLEIELNKYLYEKYIRFSHLKLLSTSTILAFMFAKEMEVRNIRILVKGKQLGLAADFIESQLVLP